MSLILKTVNNNNISIYLHININLIYLLIKWVSYVLLRYSHSLSCAFKSECENRTLGLTYYKDLLDLYY